MTKLYRIVETKRGRQKVKMIDQLKVCNARIKQLKASSPSGSTFRIEPSDTNEKFEHKSTSGRGE